MTIGHRVLGLLPLALIVAGGALAAHGRIAPGEPRSGRQPASGCVLPAMAGDTVGSPVYCAELVPVPELRQIRAVLSLEPAPSPFGVAVTVDGRARNALAVQIQGLPDPATLGDFVAYVAWITDLSTGAPERLGVVGNGITELGTVARNQFRILVTAESRAGATERSGRLVLRGTSPSVRLLAHRDMIRYGPPGFGREAGDHAHSGGGWVMPPMDPGMPMMPGFDSLLPDADPYMPAATGEIPFVEPVRAVLLADGDTLRLDAGFVRRRLRGRTLTMFAFNRQHPGPLIRVGEGATITVVFRNGLDRPSSVHWHGVRLDNRYDGAVGVTQDAVAPGESFTYRVHFRDAGIYWYHPHVREDITQDLGLYGNMLVQPSRTDAFGPANREEVVTLDDFLIGAEGAVPWGSERPTHALMGRFGNVFLTNGEPQYTLRVARGDVVRFYLTNVANSRIFNLSFEGAAMKVVGGDIGRYEREEWVNSVVLAPAERAIVDVRFTRPGPSALINRVQAISHMLGLYAPETDTLGTITVADSASAPDLASAFEALRSNDDIRADIDRYREYFDRPADHRLELRMDASRLSGALLSTMLLGYAPPVDWNDGMPMMNWLMTAGEARWTLVDTETRRENMDIAWRFRTGEIVKIALTNPADAFHPMSHPIHLHGQRFLVIGRNGRRQANLVWKDTVIVPVGETVEILLDLANPGQWMLHCHIAEHLGAGMMMTFTVAG